MGLLDNCLHFYKQLLPTSKQLSREQQLEDPTYPVFLWTCLLQRRGSLLSDYIRRCSGSYYGYNSGYSSYPYNSYNNYYNPYYNGQYYNPYYPYGYPYNGAGTPTGVIVQPGTPTTGTVVNPTNPIVIQPIRTE